MALYKEPVEYERTFGFIDKTNDLHGIDFASIYRIMVHKNFASESSVVTIFWDCEFTELVKTEFVVDNDIAIEIMNKWSAYMNEDD